MRAALVIGSIAVAVASFWLLQLLEEDGAPAAAPPPRAADYFMENMLRQSMDRDGRLKTLLRAERAEHFPIDDSTELTQPRMEIYNDSDRPWHVVAERGIVSGDGNVVILYGPVDAWRKRDDGSLEIELSTTGMRVLPREKYAETDTDVTIRTPGSETRATGMRANFGVNRIELLKDVDSRVEPDQRPGLSLRE